MILIFSLKMTQFLIMEQFEIKPQKLSANKTSNNLILKV